VLALSPGPIYAGADGLPFREPRDRLDAGHLGRGPAVGERDAHAPGSSVLAGSTSSVVASAFQSGRQTSVREVYRRFINVEFSRCNALLIDYGTRLFGEGSLSAG